MSTPAAVEPFHYVWPVGNNDVYQVKYCQGGCKPQSITPKLPAQRKLFHTVNIFGLNKHFLPRQAGGIPFRAGNDTFFCPELPRSTFRSGMQPAAQIYGGGHGKVCQKNKFVQKFFSFWNQQFLKKEMGVNLRCFGAAECWAQIPQSADLPVRTPAGPQLLLVAGAFGEPPFLYAVALFKDFQDTPE